MPEDITENRTGEPDGRTPDVKVPLFTSGSTIIFQDNCRVDETLYFGQLRSLHVPSTPEDTGGRSFDGDGFGKEMVPLWTVTSFRLAGN